MLPFPFEWSDEGHLASSTPTGGQATTYVYDGNGNRLVRKEPGATTVYLPGMELRLDTTKALSGKRFYTFAGNMVAVRSGAGVFFEAADHHGTAGCTINAATGAITTRKMTPYGTARGTPPASWPDEKHLVGGTKDSTTGLIHLGAREYDALIGAFISIDPEIDFLDPQTMQGYLYSNNNPITFSDPTGRAWGWKHRAAARATAPKAIPA